MLVNRMPKSYDFDFYAEDEISIQSATRKEVNVFFDYTVEIKPSHEALLYSSLPAPGILRTHILEK